MAPEPSAFHRAVEQYVASCEKGKVPTFVSDVVKKGQNITAQDVNASIAALEKQDSQRGSRKILKPVVEGLSDFGSLIQAMCKGEILSSVQTTSSHNSHRE